MVHEGVAVREASFSDILHVAGRAGEWVEALGRDVARGRPSRKAGFCIKSERGGK